MLQLKRHKTRVPHAANGRARGGEVGRKTHHRVEQEREREGESANSGENGDSSIVKIGLSGEAETDL